MMTKYLKTYSKFKTLAAFVAMVCIVFGMSSAIAPDANAVRVSMKRIIFDSKNKSETLTIINNSAQDKTYRIGWRRYEMDPNRSLKAVEEGQPSAFNNWAESMIRYAPKRVKVPAGSAQQIRLLFRRPAKLDEAEYRAHLWIITENAADEFSIEPKKDKGSSVKLAVQPAISLPVFVRNGDLKASANITDIDVSKASGTMNYNFTLHREGDRSLYGDMDFICASGSGNLVMHQVRGISVYTEIDHRKLKFAFPLDTPEKQACNNVKVIYKASADDKQFRGAVMAEGVGSL